MKPNKKGGKKNLPFGRRMLIFLAGVLAFVGLLAMIFCMLCPLVSPDKFVWLSFFGLAFWPILFFNVLMFVILLLLKSRKTVFISIISIALSLLGLQK